MSLEPQEAASRLVELANRNGGPDNISVLICRNGGKVPAPEGTEEAETAAAPEEGTGSRNSARRRMLVLGLILLILGLLLFILKDKPDDLQTVIRDGIQFIYDVRI